MFKRIIGKELTSLKDYRKAVVYVKDPVGETYFIDTPADEAIFNCHLSQGYTFYEVIDTSYPKEVNNWVSVISDIISVYIDIDGEYDIYALAEELVENGYRVVKSANK